MSNKVKCSHILVEKQSQAIEILQEIKNGKKFGVNIEYINEKKISRSDTVWN